MFHDMNNLTKVLHKEGYVYKIKLSSMKTQSLFTENVIV